MIEGIVGAQAEAQLARRGRLVEIGFEYAIPERKYHAVIASRMPSGCTVMQVVDMRTDQSQP